jgi:hypothetical protein
LHAPGAIGCFPPRRRRCGQGGAPCRRRLHRRARRLEPGDLAGHKVVTGLLNGEGQVRGRPAGALLIVGDVGGTVAKTR